MSARQRPTMTPQDQAAILEELRRICGADGVDANESTRARYARSTSLHAARPIGVVYPTSVHQVQAVVLAALRKGLRIHPVSSGRNWGYGDATPPTKDQLIVDLSRMNRILEVNDRLAYAVIEPGVTQGQLFDYLREHDISLWLDCSGAGRDASLVGNALERGFGHTPYSDHFSNLCGIQVVLGDGRILETGLGHDKESRAAHVYPHGLGPSLQGLLAQSNLGITTRAGLWLMPRPEAFCSFFVRVRHDEELEPVLQRLALLRLRGILRSAVHIGNDLRVLSSRMRYPWARAGNQTPLPLGLRTRLRSELGIGCWNVAGGLYGDSLTVRAALQSLRKMMQPFRVMAVGDRRLALAKKLGRSLGFLPWGQRLPGLIAALEPTYRLMKGEPVDDPLLGAAWRVRGATSDEPRDPRDLHAGLFWASPVLPATGEAARAVVNLAESIYARHRLEPLLSFAFVNDRALVCICQIGFDIREESEAESARSCYFELSQALKAANFLPYRTRPQDRKRFVAPDSVQADVSAKIKAALDPGHIISPLD
jgi:4-cresol dehydrogenase (hydroxylating)